MKVVFIYEANDLWLSELVVLEIRHLESHLRWLDTYTNNIYLTLNLGIWPLYYIIQRRR